MTVLVGILWKSGVIVASDTQFTDPSSGAVEYGNKINVVEFKPGEEILIAEAGIPAITNRIVEIIREKAKGVVIENATTITKIAEDAVRELKSQCDKDQWDQIYHGGGAEIMLAFLAAKKPQLYTLNIYGNGICLKPLKYYVAAGAGRTLAEYLLSESAEPDCSDGEAIATAIYVIKKVKDHQKGVCGGDTNVVNLGYVDSRVWRTGYISKSIRFSQELVKKTEAQLDKRASRFIKARNKKAVAILHKIGSEMWLKHRAKVEAEQKAREEEAERLRNP